MPSNPQRSRRIVREQLGRGVAGNPVHVAVRGHHACEPALDHRRLEREELFVPQLTRTEVHGRLVETAFGQSVTDHVLAGGQHPVAEIGSLELPDVRQAELGGEVRVLAVGLFDPAPARVARDVEDRAQGVAGAGRQHPPADRAGHPADEVGVERGPGADRLLEARRVQREQAVERFLVDDGRDPETRLLDQEPLDHVRRASDLRCAQVRGTGQTGDLTDAVARQCPEPFRIGSVLADHLECPDGAQLGDLLVQGHPGDEVGHACRRGQTRVPVGRRRGRHPFTDPCVRPPTSWRSAKR